MTQGRSGFHSQRGAALIEVLIAFLILAIGLIGFSALQVRAVKATQSSVQRSYAGILASSILESMRANRTAAIDPAAPYNLPSRTCTAPSDTGTLANSDLVAWFSSVKAALGPVDSTCADITCTDSNSTTPGMCTINIYWDDRRALGGVEQQSVQLLGRL